MLQDNELIDLVLSDTIDNAQKRKMIEQMISLERKMTVCIIAKVLRDFRLSKRIDAGKMLIKVKGKSQEQEVEAIADSRVQDFEQEMEEKIIYLLDPS